MSLAALFSFGSGSAAAAAAAVPVPAVPAVGSGASPATAARSSPASHTGHGSTVPYVGVPYSEPVTHRYYRGYVESLSAAVDAFADVREWADLIAALQKVARVLDLKGKFRPDSSANQHHATAAAVAAAGAGEPSLQLNFVPRAVAINLAKRLAQSLNPGLPSGVHLKALEVYELIFARLGPGGLVPQLSIWSLGLLPLLAHASSRVKPVLLGLFERFYLPLGRHLLPALPGLLLSLLPGMEEDSSETRDQVLALLEGMRQACGDNKAFMKVLWRLLLNCPQARLAAINYLAVMLPKPTVIASSGSLQLARFLASPPSLSVAALLAALHATAPDRVMTQRKGLELLLSHFPLKEPHSDVLAAATAAASAAAAAGASSAASSSSSLLLSPPAQADTSASVTRRQSDATSLQAPLSSPSSSSSSLAHLVPGSVLELEEQLQLVSGALGILLLNDVSLSRRLFTWLCPAVTPQQGQATGTVATGQWRPSERHGGGGANDDTSSAAATLPEHSLRLLRVSVLRMLAKAVPEIVEEVAVASDRALLLDDAAPAALSVSALLRPFDLLSLLLERDEVARSSLLPSLHLPLLRYLFELRGRLESNDPTMSMGDGEGSDESAIAMAAETQARAVRLARHRSTGGGGAGRPPSSPKPSAASSTESSSRYLRGGNSRAAGRHNRASAATITPAMEAIHAFYMQVPLGPVWAAVASNMKQSHQALRVLLARSNDDVSSSSSHETLDDSERRESVRVAAARLDLSVRLLDLACDVLPLEFEAMAASSAAAAPGSVFSVGSGGGGSGTPNSAATTGSFYTPSTHRTVSATPASVTPFTPSFLPMHAPIALRPGLEDPSFGAAAGTTGAGGIGIAVRPVLHELLQVALSFLRLRAFPHASFALQTALSKLLPLDSYSSHSGADAERSSFFHAVPLDGGDIAAASSVAEDEHEGEAEDEIAFVGALPSGLLRELLTQLRAVRDHASAAGPASDQLWEEEFSVELLEDCRADCLSALLSLLDVLLGVAGGESDSEVIHPSSAAQGAQQPTASSVPPSPFLAAGRPAQLFSVPPSPALSATVLQPSSSGASTPQRARLSIKVAADGGLSGGSGAATSTTAPPVLAMTTDHALSSAHVQLLRVYHAELLELLLSSAAADGLDGGFECVFQAVTHWITLAEWYASVLFDRRIDEHDATDNSNASDNLRAHVHPVAQAEVFSHVLHALWSLLHPSCSHVHTQVGHLFFRLLRLEAARPGDVAASAARTPSSPSSSSSSSLSCVAQVSEIVLHPLCPNSTASSFAPLLLLEGYSKLMALWRLLVNIELERQWSRGMPAPPAAAGAVDNSSASGNAGGATSPSVTASNKDFSVLACIQAWLWILLDALHEAEGATSSSSRGAGGRRRMLARPPQLRLLARAWLQDALATSLSSVLDPMLAILLHAHTVAAMTVTPRAAATSVSSSLNSAASVQLPQRPLYAHVFDVRRVLFALESLSALISSRSSSGGGGGGDDNKVHVFFVEQLMRTRPSPQAAGLYDVHRQLGRNNGGFDLAATTSHEESLWAQPRTYLQLLCFTLLHFVRARFPGENGAGEATPMLESLRAAAARIRSRATELLLRLVSSIPVSSVSVHMSVLLAPHVLLALAHCTTGTLNSAVSGPAQAQKASKRTSSNSTVPATPTVPVALSPEHDTVMQLQLLALLRVLLAESHRRVDSPDAAESGRAETGGSWLGTGPVLGQPLFLQTVLAGIRAASPLSQQPAPAAVAPRPPAENQYRAPGNISAAASSSSPSSLSSPLRSHRSFNGHNISGNFHFGTGVVQEAPLTMDARTTLATLSLLPRQGRVQSFFPEDEDDDVEGDGSRSAAMSPPAAAPTVVPTLSQWLEFALAMLPLTRTAMPNFATALLACLCGELHLSAAELARVQPLSSSEYAAPSSGPVPSPSSTAAAAAASGTASVSAVAATRPRSASSSRHMAALSAAPRSSTARSHLLRSSPHGGAATTTNAATGGHVFWRDNAGGSVSSLSGVSSPAAAASSAVSMRSSPPHSAVSGAVSLLLSGLKSLLLFCLSREKMAAVVANERVLQGGGAVDDASDASSSSAGGISSASAPVTKGLVMSSNGEFMDFAPSNSSSTNAPSSAAANAAADDSSLAGNLIHSFASVFSGGSVSAASASAASQAASNAAAQRNAGPKLDTLVRDAAYQALPRVVEALLAVWSLPTDDDAPSSSSTSTPRQRWSISSSSSSLSTHSSSRHHWVWSHRSLHSSVLRLLESLFTRNAPQMFAAVANVWERSLADLLAGRVLPASGSTASGEGGSDTSGEEGAGASAAFDALHLSATHHGLLRLLHALGPSVGSAEAVIACLVPLVMQSIARAQPHQRSQRVAHVPSVGDGAAVRGGSDGPSGSPLASPSTPSAAPSFPSSSLLPSNSGSGGSGSGAGAHGGAMSSQAVTQLPALGECAHAALSLLYHYLASSTQVERFSALWSNSTFLAAQESTTSSAATSASLARSDVLPLAVGTGSLAALLGSPTLLQSFDHPLTLLWLLSIMRVWCSRGKVVQAGPRAARRALRAKKDGSALGSGAGKPPISSSSSSSSNNSAGIASVASAAAAAASLSSEGADAVPLDRKVLRDVQNSVHNLLVAIASLVGDSVEMSLPLPPPASTLAGASAASSATAAMVARCHAMLGVNAASLPPALHYIAPRNEATDLVPPLPPWLDMVARASAASAASAAAVAAGGSAVALACVRNNDRHPSWPHKQVTSPQSVRAWRVLLHEQIPLATGSLLHSSYPHTSVSLPAPAVRPPAAAGGATSSVLSPTSSSSSSPTPAQGAGTPPRRTPAGRQASSGIVTSVGRGSVNVTLVALRCLSNVLAPLLLDSFHAPFALGVGGAGPSAGGSDAALVSDSESRAAALLSALMPLLLPVLQHHHPLHLPFVAPVVALLASLASPSLGFAFKAWRQEGWAHFMASNDGLLPALPAPPSSGGSGGGGEAVTQTIGNGFFCTDVVSLSQWRWVLSRIVDEDASLLGAFIQTDKTGGGLNLINLNLAQMASSVMGGAMLTGGLSSSSGGGGSGGGGGAFSSSSTLSAGSGGVLTPFSGLFGSSESLLSSRRSALKKLAFLIHAGRRDQYARHLSAILEKVTENLKIVAPGAGAAMAASSSSSGSPHHPHHAAHAPSSAEAALARSVNALHASVFLCLRVLLARVSPEHLQSIWPIVLMELIRIFQSSSAAPLSADPLLLSAACKFIDVAIVMMPAQFVLYIWMFLRESVEEFFSAGAGAGAAAGGDATLSSASQSGTGAPTTTLLSQSASPRTPINPATAQLQQQMQGGFVPHVQHLEFHEAATTSNSSADSAASVSSPTPSSSHLLRPVLLQRHVTRLSDLSSFHARLSSAMSAAFHRAHPQPQPQPQPDVAFVDALLLSDMIDYPEIDLPLPTTTTRPTMMQAQAAAQHRHVSPSQHASTLHSSGQNHLVTPSTALSVRASTPTPSPQPPNLQQSNSRGLSVNPLASPLPPTAAAAATPASLARQQQHSSSNKPPVASPPTRRTQQQQQLHRSDASLAEGELATADLRGSAPSEASPRPSLPFAKLSSLVQGKPMQIKLPKRSSRA